MKNLLKSLIREIILERNVSRVQVGDAAQMRIAAFFVDRKPDSVASVNKPGSSSTDVIVSNSKKESKIEVKSSASGRLVYAQELTSGSKIAEVIHFEPGTVQDGLSIKRFKPAKSGTPLDDDLAQSIRKEENATIQTAVSKESEDYKVLFGGSSNAIEPVKSGLQFINTLATDGTIVINAGDKFRQTAIVLAPGQAKDKSRVRFWANGSSKLRAALGGEGQQELGSYTLVDSKTLSDAWRLDYSDDDYFAIVTGNKIHIGRVKDADPLSLEVNQLNVALSMPKESNKTLAYGGTNVSGLREKIMIEIVGTTAFDLPTIEEALNYQKEGKIIVR
jgi:hypothetical protein